MQLYNNNHSVFMMYYHLVLVIKYRKKVIDNDISTRLREIFEYIAPNNNMTLQEWNYDNDLYMFYSRHTPTVSCQSSLMPIKARILA